MYGEDCRPIGARAHGSHRHNSFGGQQVARTTHSRVHLTKYRAMHIRSSHSIFAAPVKRCVVSPQLAHARFCLQTRTTHKARRARMGMAIKLSVLFALVTRATFT